jgi:hypothetical protein
MVENQRTPGACFIVSMGLVAFLAYALSVAPVCCVSSRVGGEKVVSIVYRPLTWAAEVTGNDALMSGIRRYSELGAAGVYTWTFNPDAPGNAQWNHVRFNHNVGMGIRIVVPPLSPGAPAE